MSNRLVFGIDPSLIPTMTLKEQKTSPLRTLQYLAIYTFCTPDKTVIEQIEQNEQIS